MQCSTVTFLDSRQLLTSEWSWNKSLTHEDKPLVQKKKIEVFQNVLLFVAYPRGLELSWLSWDFVP